MEIICKKRQILNNIINVSPAALAKTVVKPFVNSKSLDMLHIDRICSYIHTVLILLNLTIENRSYQCKLSNADKSKSS